MVSTFGVLSNGYCGSLNAGVSAYLHSGYISQSVLVALGVNPRLICVLSRVLGDALSRRIHIAMFVAIFSCEPVVVSELAVLFVHIDRVALATYTSLPFTVISTQSR